MIARSDYLFGAKALRFRKNSIFIFVFAIKITTRSALLLASSLAAHFPYSKNSLPMFPTRYSKLHQYFSIKMRRAAFGCLVFQLLSNAKINI